MTKQLVYVQNKVNNAAIRRIRNERGDLVYVVPSYTLPDNVVMNGGLYPAEEIANSYMTLEDTPAPAGHPYNANGEYVSANSPDGVLYFQCGIFNKNVQRVEDEKYGYRVYVEKHVHVDTAMQSDRGRRIIEAIDNGEPIHTSTGIILESMPEEGVNKEGKPYSWRAMNMFFDHDSILLDEEGAATPADGVGMMVNTNLLKQVNREGVTLAVNTATPQVNQSFDDLREVLQTKVQKKFGSEGKHLWITDFGDGYAVFEDGQTAYMVDYMRDDEENIMLGEDAQEVKKKTLWERVSTGVKKVLTSPFVGTPTTNREGNDMFKEHIQKQLKANSIDITDMDDAAMLEAYESMLKANAAEETVTEGEQSQPEAEAVTKADIEAIVNARLEAMQTNQEAGKRGELAEKLKANGVDLSESEQKAMSVNSLQALVDKTTHKPASFLAGGTMETNSKESQFSDTLPE